MQYFHQFGYGLEVGIMENVTSTADAHLLEITLKHPLSQSIFDAQLTAPLKVSNILY